MSRKRLFLIDGMSHLYRSFFAIRNLANSKGLPTNALYGFTMMLRKLIKDDQPDYLAVCWDTPEPTVRHQASETYKANRALMPDDLSPQVAYVEKLCAALNVALLKMPGYEADDIIGTLSKLGAAANLQVVIVSNDKDMGQLVNDHVCIMKYDKSRYVICDAAAVKEWLGVQPHQVVDLLGLMGDSADNVPGAPGIGEKGAVQLIEQFGSIEEALARWSEVSRKTYRESLRDHAEQIRLSRQLVTIHTELPIQLNLDELRRREPNTQAAHQLFTELEFSGLVREFAANLPTTLPATAPASGMLPFDELPAGGVQSTISTTSEQAEQILSQPDLPLNYHQVVGDTDLKQLTDQIWAEDGFTFAVAGTTETGATQMLEKLSLSFAPGQAAQLDLAEHGDAALATLKEFWSNGILNKAVHDSKQALTLINNAYKTNNENVIRLAGLSDDIFLAAYLLEPEQAKYSLPELALQYLGIEREKAAQLDAADLTARLVPVLRRHLKAAGLDKIYQDMELPLVDILYDMEQVGVAIDTATLAELSAQFEVMLNRLVQEIYTLAGQEFNINSTIQLGEVFEKLNFTLSRKTKTGRISTSADVLEELATRYELPGKILEYRELAKLKNTYVDALPKLINPRTGRIHTTINQTIAATGRLSSTNPNLQNIPIRTELGRSIRRAFVAGEGYILLSADYSQIELRLLADIANDAKMIEAFQQNEDIHTKTAREVFGARTDAEMKEKRRLAKSTNFGIAYGVSAFGLAKRVGITRTEAKEAIENYYATYTGVRRYMEELPEQGRRNNGIVRTMFGRMRKLPNLVNQNHNLREAAEREAINAPIQGTAADLVKMAMIKIYNRLHAEQLKSRFLLQVHDELLLEVVPSEVERVKEIVKYEMENVHPLRVPLLVEVRTGKNWFELK